MTLRKYMLATVMMMVITTSHAQDIFDLMGYVIPPGGWSKKAGNDFVSLTYQEPSVGYAVIGLYRSMPTSGTPEADAKLDWDELVMKRYPDVLLLKFENNKIPNSEWNAILQFGLVTKNEVDIGVSTVTFTGFSRHLVVAFESTNKDLDHFLPEFLAQMTLYQPPKDSATVSATSPPPTTLDSAAAESEATRPASIIGKWKRSAADFSNFFTGHKTTTKGDAQYHYTFSDDNTYDFHSEQWSEEKKCMFFQNEQGSFKLDGSTLKLYPAKSVIEKRGYKDGKGVAGGPLLESKNLSLTPTKYSWNFYYGENTHEWSLALQTEKQTDRDGAFSAEGTLPNVYYYIVDK